MKNSSSFVSFILASLVFISPVFGQTKRELSGKITHIEYTQEKLIGSFNDLVKDYEDLKKEVVKLRTENEKMKSDLKLIIENRYKYQGTSDRSFTNDKEIQSNDYVVKLDRYTFLPDASYKTIWPWREVERFFDKQLDSGKFPNHTPCPKCGRKSEELVWIYYTSPDWTWKQLCGREGPLSICPSCKIQVEFMVERLN